MSYEENRTYISQSEHEAIIQRINDCYSDEFITGHDFIQIYNQLLDEYIHDDELYIYNNTFDD